MIGSNPLLAPILAASMTNSPSGLGAPTPPSGPTGLPGLLSNLPGMANPQGNDMGQQTQMLQAMSQLLMLNNPGTAPNPSLQSAALLQNQVSIDNVEMCFYYILTFTELSAFTNFKMAYFWFYRCKHLHRQVNTIHLINQDHLRWEIRYHLGLGHTPSLNAFPLLLGHLKQC